MFGSERLIEFQRLFVSLDQAVAVGAHPRLVVMGVGHRLVGVTHPPMQRDLLRQTGDFGVVVVGNPGLIGRCAGRGNRGRHVEIPRYGRRTGGQDARDETKRKHREQRLATC